MTGAIKKIAAFSANWQTACPVIRILSPARALGIEVETFTVDFQLGDFEDVDAIVVLRDFPRFRTAYERIIEWSRKARKPVIFTIDDLLTELPREHPSYAEYREIRPHLLRGLIQADLVVVTTPELKSRFDRYNDKIVVVPNYLDETIWTLAAPGNQVPNASRTVIGYMGTASHVADLDLLSSVLASILDEHRGRVQFKSYGTELPELLSSRDDAQYIPLDLDGYSDFASYFCKERIDIFVAPLVDNDFNRCKSSIKFLEYSALGVPGVYSSLPPYSMIVRCGENGILADNEAAWRDGISALLFDEEYRNRLGKAAFNSLRVDGLVSQHPDQWLEMLSEARPRIQLDVAVSDLYAKEMSEWCHEILSELETERHFHQSVERSRAWRLASTLRGLRSTMSK